ncbi:hypothetical protein LCGC14_2727440 [marine sediment metagenome]|uniref:Uncharacterized protein n=1 Tax=marine sediment metagenome TaxID=412755 RepID=A0A0F8Z8A8_9ZZZZ
MGTVKDNWTDSMCLTAEEEERMPMPMNSGPPRPRPTPKDRLNEERVPMGRIIEMRVSCSPLQEAAVKAAVKCPECNTQEAIQVKQSLLLRAELGKAQRTEYWALCSCGCQFTVTWEDTSEQVSGSTD